MKWEKKEKIGIVEFTEKIKKMSNEVVKNELEDLNNKIISLHKMGLIKDKKSIEDLKEKMGKIGL